MTTAILSSRKRPSPSNQRRYGLRLAVLSMVVLAPVWFEGSVAQAGIFSDWWESRQSSAASDLGIDPITSSSNSKSFFDRWMTRAKTPFTSSLFADSPTLFGQRAWNRTRPSRDPISESELSAALKLVESGQLEAAERVLKTLAKREVAAGTPYGMKAQYWLAETQFRMQKFVKSEENFETLAKKYVGTEYTDKIAARQFQIAQFWLSAENPKAKPLEWRTHFDGRAPLVDTSGFAVKALEHARMNSAEGGPLADDSLLRLADHYHLVKDYDSASHYYDELITDENLRKSEYRERAMLTSIDSKIKAYSGPEYDMTGLEQASDMIDKVFQEYPDNKIQSESLYHTKDLIKDQYAERAFKIGMDYLKAKKAASAEYYFGMVIAKWPQSQWAGKAREQMQLVAQMPRTRSVPSKIMTQPGAADPSTMGGNGGNNGGPGGAMGGLMNTMGGMGTGGMGMGGGGMGPN